MIRLLHALFFCAIAMQKVVANCPAEYWPLVAISGPLSQCKSGKRVWN